MLDYEGIKYTVEFTRIGAVCFSDRVFDTEEEAISFIKKHREGWSRYCLEKKTWAIIDF